ncbi:MAG: hypothetical protein AB7P17_08900 [Nitrospirales bacterium]|nr:SWIM zinc finger family protein [Nitrospirales bacterium]
MRNRIACSAQELFQLDPEMVQSVVGGQVFKIGNQYFADSRVNILESDATQVVAEVNGTYGVYSQTIKLKGGTLSTKCSCPSTEQPFCRHCVAVLLHQFHNGSSQNHESGSPKVEPTPPPQPKEEPGFSADEPSSSADLNFKEATLFIDWFQQVVGRLGKASSFPDASPSLRGTAREWIGVIERLNQQFLESEEDRIDAQKGLQAAEAGLETLTKELEVVKGESSRAQDSCKELESKVKALEKSLIDFEKISNERDRLVGKVSAMQSELQSKGAELESVSMTLKSLSKAIRNLAPSDSSS